MKKIILAILLLPLSINCLQAQKISVKAIMDSTVIWIGEQAHLSFQVSQLPNQKVIMPLFSDTIVGGLEIVDSMKVDSTKTSDGHLLVTSRYTVTSFKDSLIYVPSYPFILNGDTVWSNSLSLKVIQPFKIDTASHKIADIKQVMTPPFYWWGLIRIILLVLLIIALLVTAYFLFRKYWQKRPMFEKSEPQIKLPAHVEALQKLEHIKAERLWQQGRIKEYHTELTDVMREYIERVFNIRSMEMTSEEILDEVKVLRQSKKSAFDSLKQILQIADLVKFAKWSATPEENETSLMNAYLFVNQTKVEEVQPIEEIAKEEVKPED